MAVYQNKKLKILKKRRIKQAIAFFKHTLNNKIEVLSKASHN